jgi:hypothetical protein
MVQACFATIWHVNYWPQSQKLNNKCCIKASGCTYRECRDVQDSFAQSLPHSCQPFEHQQGLA